MFWEPYNPDDEKQELLGDIYRNPSDEKETHRNPSDEHAIEIRPISDTKTPFDYLEHVPQEIVKLILSFLWNGFDQYVVSLGRNYDQVNDLATLNTLYPEFNNLLETTGALNAVFNIHLPINNRLDAQNKETFYCLLRKFIHHNNSDYNSVWLAGTDHYSRIDFRGSQEHYISHHRINIVYEDATHFFSPAFIRWFFGGLLSYWSKRYFHPPMSECRATFGWGLLFAYGAVFYLILGLAYQGSLSGGVLAKTCLIYLALLCCCIFPFAVHSEPPTEPNPTPDLLQWHELLPQITKKARTDESFRMLAYDLIDVFRQWYSDDNYKFINLCAITTGELDRLVSRKHPNLLDANGNNELATIIRTLPSYQQMQVPHDTQQEIQQLLNQLEDALTRSHMEPVD